jgi:O-antigen/teichoic acid export membrane protein
MDMDTDAPDAATPAAGAPPASAASGITQLLSDTSWYLVANVASKIVGFVMIPFYAGFLSAEEYGTLNLLELATTIVAIGFGLQALGQSLTRIYHDAEDEATRRQVVSTAVIGTILLGGLIAIVACLAAAPIGRLVSLPGQAALLRLSFAAMFTGGVSEVALVYERMRNRARFYFAYAMVTMIGMLGLNILLIGFAHQGVWGFVYSKLTVTALGAAYLTWRILAEVGGGWRWHIARALGRFAGPLVLSGACYFAIHFSDRLFLAHVSKAEVGVYSLAYSFAFLLSILIGDSFNKSWNVSFYGLSSGDGWQARFVQVGRWLMFVLGTGAIGISLFGRDVLTVMVPSSYYPPMLLLPVLVFGYFLREVGDFFNSMLLIGIGSGLVGRIALAGALVNLLLNALLIPNYGIWGAAWATFATWAAYCAVAWLFAWRVHGVAMTPWALAVILLLSGASLYMSAAFALHGVVLRLAVDAGVFAFYVVSAMILYLKRSERKQALAMAFNLMENVRRRT